MELGGGGGAYNPIRHLREGFTFTSVTYAISPPPPPPTTTTTTTMTTTMTITTTTTTINTTITITVNTYNVHEVGKEEFGGGGDTNMGVKPWGLMKTKGERSTI